MPESKLPFRAERQRSDKRLFAQFPFIIRMPTDAIVAVSVQINQYRIKGEIQARLDLRSYIGQQNRPWSGLQQVVAIAVSNPRIGVPGLQSGQDKLTSGDGIPVIGPVLFVQ